MLMVVVSTMVNFLKEIKMAKRKKKTLEQRKAMPNNLYWRKHADEIFMQQFRGLPCEACKVLGRLNEEGTVFHHIVAKKHSKALRYDHRNGIILCPSHHGFSDVMCAHSMTAMIVAKFQDFFEEHFPLRHQWIVEHRRLKFRYTYKEAFEYMSSGSNIEYTYDMELLPF